MSNFNTKQLERSNRKHLGVATGIAGNGTKGRPKTGKETKIRVNFTIFPSLIMEIRHIAGLQNKSVSEILDECFRRYFKEHKDLYYNDLPGLYSEPERNNDDYFGVLDSSDFND